MHLVFSRNGLQVFSDMVICDIPACTQANDSRAAVIYGSAFVDHRVQQSEGLAAWVLLLLSIESICL